MQISSAPGQGTRVTVMLPFLLEQTRAIGQQQVLIVDDSPLFVNGLQHLLTAYGYSVVGVAHDGEQGIELAQHLRPDLILMDVEMPGLNGLEATRRIKQEWPDVQIVMLTIADDDDYLFEALRSGADGYLLKSLAASDLLQRLQGLTRGEAPLSPGLATRLLRTFADQPPTPEADTAFARLNPTQRDILALVAAGHTYREVGMQLGFSEDTIKKYMGRIVRLLQVQNRAAAITYARRYLEREVGGR